MMVMFMDHWPETDHTKRLLIADDLSMVARLVVNTKEGIHIEQIRGAMKFVKRSTMWRRALKTATVVMEPCSQIR